MIEVIAMLVLSGILVYRRLTIWQDFNSTVGGRYRKVRVGPKGQKGFIAFYARDAKKTQKPRRIQKPKKVAASSEIKKPWGW